MEDQIENEMEPASVSSTTVSSLHSAFNMATFTHSQISEADKTNFEAATSSVSCFPEAVTSQGETDSQRLIKLDIYIFLIYSLIFRM